MPSVAENDLFGTTWIATSSQHDVNNLKISFNAPQTCVVSLVSGGPVQRVSCNWSESFTGGHFFGLTGGSISLVGSCSVSQGTGTAQGFAVGSTLESWTFTKSS